MLLAVICIPAQAQLTQSGLTLSFDANQDQDGNNRWESYVAGSILDMRLDPSVLRSTGTLTSGFAGITNAYVFPGSGITEIAANALGAEFSTTGSTSSQASLSASGVTATTSASWEIWFRPDSLDTGGVTQVLFEDGGGTGIGLFLNNNILTARKAPGGTAKTFDLSGLTTGDFSQVVMTYNISGALELYINGVVVPGGPATGTGGSWSGGDGAALGTRGQANMGGIGNGSQSVANFDGDIAAFRFYSGVLSGTDVTANYNAITATTVFFDNDASDGFWTTQTNWDTNIQPTSAQNVVINNGFSVTSNTAGETANDLTIGSTAGSTLSPGVISGTGALAVTGGDLTVAGILTLGDGQDGTLTLSGGILNSNGAIVAGTGGTSTLTLSGGTLNMNGNAIGSGVAPVTSLVFESGTLDSISGINGTGALNKTTGGTLTLSGTNTYTGATNVNEGTLVITGSNTSAITVASGANLDGEGTTTGNLLFLGANHTITANTDTPAALGTSGSVDVDALDPGGFTINIAGGAFAGTIDVLSYGSLSSGGLGKFVANTSLAPSVRGAILGDSGTAITYDLGYVTNTWQGSAPSNNTFWDVGTTANWSNAKDSVFQNGDDVIFDDTAARFNPNLRVNVTAGTVTFSNETNNYTLNSLSTSQTLTIDQGVHFTGSGNVTINPKIDGSGNLVQSGTGTTTLNAAATYTGTTTITAGTLKLVNAAISNRVYEPIAAGATLEFNVTTPTNPGTFSLSGDGTFLKTGTSAFTQTSGGSTFAMGSGALIRIAEGSFDFGAGTPGNWNANKADLQVDFNANFDGSATDIVIDALDGGGTVKIAGNGFGLKLGVDNGNGIFTGTIVNSTPDGNQFSVIKEGSGTQILSGNNTYSGATTVNGGLLVVNGSLTGNISVGNNANIGGEASTAGDLIFLGTSHTLDIDATTAAALGSTGTGSTNLSAVTGTFTVNVAGTGTGGTGELVVLTYGSGSFSGDLNNFILGSHTLSSRAGSAGAFIDNGMGAITIDLGYVANTWVGGAPGNPNLWNIGTTANWSNNADTVFQSGDDAIFGDGASNLMPTLGADISAGTVIFTNTTGTDYTLGSTASGVLTIAGALNISGSGDVTINTAFSTGGGVVLSGTGNTLINGRILGSGGLTQSGGGVTTLAGNNALTGPAVITGGTLQLNNELNLGSKPTGINPAQLIKNGAAPTLSATSTFTINDINRGITLGSDGGRIGAESGVTLTIDNVISGSGALEKVGPGILNLTAANTYLGTTTVSAGTLQLTNDAITVNRVYAPVGSGATLEFNVTSGSPNGGTINLTGTGTFKKTGANTFTHTSAGSIVAMGSGALFYIAEGLYDFGGSGLGDWTGNLSDLQVDRGATFDGSATAIVVDALNGAGAVKIAGNATDGFGLKLGVDNGSGIFSGVISNSTPDGTMFSLIKEGTGTQILSGNNTYSGDTTVNAGRLDVNGSPGGSLTVADDAGVGGEATYAGTVTFGSTGNTSLYVDGSTTAALTAVGALTTDNGMINVVVEKNGAGAFTVLNYNNTESNSMTAGAADFITSATTTARAGFGGAVFADTGSAITLNLGFENRTWNNGSSNGLWNKGAASSANWVEGDTLFYDGDLVTFSDTPGSNQTITLTENVAPSSVTFSNATRTYTINSSAGETISTSGGITFSGGASVTINSAITGTGGLTRASAGNTILSGANNYTGDTIISLGSLTLGANNVIGDSSAVVLAGGTFNLNGKTETLHSVTQTGGNFSLNGADVTLLNDSSFNNITGNSGVSVIRVADGTTLTSTVNISSLGNGVRVYFDVQGNALANVSAPVNVGKGNGSIDKLGTGTLRLTADTSQYGGGNRIENGILEFTSIVNSGTDQTSSLGDADFENVLQIGSTATAATLRMIGTNSKNSSNRAVQLGAAGGTIDIENSAQTLTLSGVVSDLTSSGALTKAGEGTLVLSGSSTYSGGTTVSDGILLVNNTAGSGTGAGSVTVSSGTTLGGTGTIAGDTTISGTLSTGSSAAVGTVGTLNFSGSPGTTDVTFTSGSTWLIDLVQGGTPGSDSIVMDGALTINSGANLSFNTSGSFAGTETYTLATYGSLAGSFSDFSTSGIYLIGGNSYHLEYGANAITLTAVPEPGTIGLLGFLLGGIMVRRFSRRRFSSENGE